MTPQPSFGPEALARFDLTMNEVCNELRAERPALSMAQLRTGLARPLIAIASAGLNDDQAKQLLLRKIRNEWSVTRHWSAREQACISDSLDG